MAEGFLLYYITDRAAFSGDERTRRHRLLEKITEAALQGVDYVQLREKDLTARELESLAREALNIILKLKTQNPALRTAFLINSRTDIAMATGADGVHLPAEDISPAEVRAAWKRGVSEASPLARHGSRSEPIVGVSCHSLREVAMAGAKGATFAVFAPVFEKKNAPASRPAGLDALRQASELEIPVVALGGVTLENAESCIAAGASGIAGIRLFQENDIAAVVQALRR